MYDVERVSMGSYLLRRASLLVPQIFTVIIIAFTLIKLAPGNPIMTWLPTDQPYSQEYYKTIERMLGLDRPIHEQLLLYIWNVLHGDLGTSNVFMQPVLPLLLSRFRNTMMLIITSFLWPVPISIVLGVISSKRPGSVLDGIITVIATAGWSIPYFWYGQMLIILFALNLNVLPAGGVITLEQNLTGMQSIIDQLRHLALPSLCLGTAALGLTTRITRAGMLETLGSDFIVLARSKGLSDRTVTYKHALRNSLSPIITAVGLDMGRHFGGAILTEVVFTYPGVGRLMFEAVLLRDAPVLMGVFIFFATAVILINFATDLTYALVDPRVRYK